MKDSSKKASKRRSLIRWTKPPGRPRKSEKKETEFWNQETQPIEKREPGNSGLQAALIESLNQTSLHNRP